MTIADIKSFCDECSSLTKKEARQLHKQLEHVKSSVLDQGEQTVFGCDWTISDCDVIDGLLVRLKP